MAISVPLFMDNLICIDLISNASFKEDTKLYVPMEKGPNYTSPFTNKE